VGSPLGACKQSSNKLPFPIGKRYAKSTCWLNCIKVNCLPFPISLSFRLNWMVYSMNPENRLLFPTYIHAMRSEDNSNDTWSQPTPHHKKGIQWLPRGLVHQKMATPHIYRCEACLCVWRQWATVSIYGDERPPGEVTQALSGIYTDTRAAPCLHQEGARTSVA
jgi:hypothetical protein